MPHLTHFALHDKGPRFFDDVKSTTIRFPSESFLSELDEALLPNLESLSLPGIRLNPSTIHEMLAFAASRSLSRLSGVDLDDVHPLKELCVDIPTCSEDRLLFTSSEFQSRTLEMMKTLNEEGVKIVFQDVWPWSNEVLDSRM
ncbi:hypothetical protein L218DRAFT_1005272 [Marasmius fiardii PR-910]|nr:hypothetical protein L218DRAFT_1005272 [Marasmius fiardii PR-910]